MSWWKLFIYNVKHTKASDPAIHSTMEVVFLYPHLKALCCYRIAHACYKRHLYFLARMISGLGRFFTGIEIHPGATIGKGLFIDHGMGVVIGETAIIGDDCTIYQGVTLGGTGKEKGKRHPTLGNRVICGSGSKVLGNITLEDDVLVAANAIVTKSIEKQHRVYGYNIVRH